MSQSQTPSSASPPFARLRYKRARALVLDQRNSLSPVMDKDSARSWVVAFGAAMRDLSDCAEAVGIDLTGDTEVDGLLDFARENIIHLATSDWLELAPALLDGAEETVRQLGPGVTLGEAYSHLLSWSAQPDPVAAAPQSSARPSVPSPATIPPPSPRLPSSGSGISRPVPSGSDARRATRSTKPLPRSAHRRAGQSSTAASSRPRTEAAALSPGNRPKDWESCARCRQRKKGCVPPKGAGPLASSCFLCLRDGVTCARGPEAASLSHSRRLFPPPPPLPAKPAKRSAPAPAPSPPPTEPPSLFPESSDDQFSDVLPAFPLHGSRSAPLSDLLAWHGEIYASKVACVTARAAQHTAVAAREAATAALDAAAAALEVATIQERIAASRIASADRRRRVAWENYCSLLGNVYVDSSPSLAPGAPGGKRKARRSLR